MRGSRAFGAIATLTLIGAAGSIAPNANANANADGSTTSLAPHLDVRGEGATRTDVRPAGSPWSSVRWDDLGVTPRVPGLYEVRARFDSRDPGDAVAIPWCAGTKSVSLDGRAATLVPGPQVLPVEPGSHALVLRVTVGAYERRIACGDDVRVGVPRETVEGLGLLRFPNEGRGGGGQAVVFIPPGHDPHRPGPVLVGAHPWNGSIWTYAAYRELFRAAADDDVVLLMPSALGNSLYTAAAETEVLSALDALGRVVAVDRRAVSIWGASMGGAGATTISFHHPDRFASVTSFFGDSKYDLSTYARAILQDEHAAHLVNALDVVDNARHLPVWLIHGEDDRTSAIAQSRMLATALRQKGFDVRFDAVSGVGHSGALVARFLPQVVSRAASARIPADIARVTYRSARPEDLGAYGIHFVRADDVHDAFVDVERREDGVHVLRAEGVRSMSLDPGALGSPIDPLPRIVIDAPDGSVTASWGPAP